jgi:hypothetical protein
MDKVLHHQVEAETGVEAARQHELAHLLLRAVVHAGGGVQHVHHQPGVQAEALAHQQGLRGDEEAAGADQVVQRLHRLAGADAAAAVDAGAHGAEHRLRPVQRRVVAARHDGEFARLRARHAAGDRAVHHRTSRAARAVAISRVRPGWPEVMSMKSVPGASASATVAATSATWALVGRMVTTQSAPRTASAASAAA